MKAYKKGAVAIIATAALALTACNGTTTTGPGSSTNPSSSSSAKAGNSNKTAQASWNPQPRENIKDGGTLTTALGEITPQLNQWHSDMTADTGDLWSWYNPVLSYFTPEGEIKFDKNYVVEMPKDSVKDGKTQVTYKLNEKATYNDGTPIDWKSFEAAWKACGEVTPDDYNCNSTDGYKMIEKVEKGATDKDVVVTFKQAYPWWQGLFQNLLHPKALDKEVFAKGYTNGQAHPEWGAGPFKLDPSFDAKGDTVTFIPNEKWWGDKPKLEKRIMKVMEANASINAFKNGQIDVTGVANKDYLAQVQDMVKAGTVELRKGNRTSSNLLTLNSASPKLKDPKVREAIFSGIDRKAIMAIMFQGLDYTEEAPGSFTLFPYQKGYKDNFSSVVQYDKEKANKILDEAGWKKGSDGIREKDGTKLQLNLPIFGDATLTKSRATAVQAMLKDIGVDLQVVAKPSSDFSKVMKAKDFDMVMSGFLSSDPYGMAYICQIYCSNSTLNKSATGTKELDDKLHAVEMLPTADEQIAKGNEVEQEAFKTFGIMPLYNGVSIVATKKGIANYGSSVFGFAPKQDIGWQK